MAAVAVLSGCVALGLDLSYFNMLTSLKKINKNVNLLRSCFVSLTLIQGHDLM